MQVNNPRDAHGLFGSAGVAKACSDTIDCEQESANECWISFFTLLANSIEKTYLQKLKWF
jgi:hypothetical protein